MRKVIKKLIATLTASCLLVNAVPFIGFAETESKLTYTFANDFVANADGVIQYKGSDYAAEDVATVTLYWGDASGVPLTGWSAFDETDWGTLTSGYKVTGSRVIPWGAETLVAKISFVDEATETVSVFVTIPEEKRNSGDEEYTMFLTSDSHVDASEDNNTEADKASMITRFTALKDLMDSLTEAGDNVIGVSLLGDIAVGEHTSTGGHGYWLAYDADYECADEVLKESGIEDSYPIWYVNGNHDIIECVNGDDSAWIQFMDKKIALVNEKIANQSYAENVLAAIRTVEKESQVYWYDTYVGENHFIYISVPYSGFGIYSEEELAWLDELLAEDAVTGKTTFVLGHYPMSYTHSEAAGHFDNSEVLETILEKYPNTIYVSGHLHGSPESTNNIIVGDNKATLVNTGSLREALNLDKKSSEDGYREYKSNGVYCKVFEDRIEFYARIFYNFDAEDTSGYWVTQMSNVVNLKNTVNAELSAEIKTDSEQLRNGTTATAYLNGAVVDTTAYNCKWYVGNTYVGTGATYTLSNVTTDGIEVPSGSLSVKVTDAADPTNYVWAISDAEAEVFIEISTAEELAKIGVDENYPLDGKYILMNDIDLAGYENWEPIGSMVLGTNGFTGVLEGNGNTIKNMTVSLSEIEEGASQIYGGLFAHTVGAEIRNLVMYNANMTGGSSCQVFAGAITGDAESDTAGNPTVFKNVSIVSSSVTITLADRNIAGGGAFVGTVNKKYTSNRVGGAKFVNCYSDADIKVDLNGGQSTAGGFAGYIYGTKTPCEITNSIFDGTIVGHTGGNTRIGGFFGKATQDDTVVAKSYSNADNYTEKAAEEKIYPVSGAMLTTDFLTRVIAEELGLGETWIDSEQGPIPSIAKRWVLYSDYISISTADELAKIGVEESYPLDGKYVLTNDIDLSGYTNWDPIGVCNADTDAFSGVLEGNGYAIKNLTVSATTIEDGADRVYGGLFAYTMGAEIRNLVMVNATITGNNTKQVFVGVLVGDAEANTAGNPTLFSNVSVISSTVEITAPGSTATGGGSFAGSVSKRKTTNRGGGAKFINCYSDANITVKLNNNQSTAGGFVGYVYGYSESKPCEIVNSIFDGEITGISGGYTRVGGFFGRIGQNNTIVENSYSNSSKYIECTIDRSDYSVSGTKLTTEGLTAMTVSEKQLGENWVDSTQGPIPAIAKSWILYADYVQISSAKELAKIGVEDSYPLDGKYVLVNDIDLSGYVDWDPIGPMNVNDGAFSGVLEGNGYTIQNMTVSLNEMEGELTEIYGGLFSNTMGAEIRNLVMENATLSGGNSNCYIYAGTITGNAESDSSGKPTVFSNIAVIDSKISITEAHYKNVAGGGSFSGAVNKRYTSNRAGGANFINCYSNADITVDLNGAQSTAGGFVGYVYNTKTPCTITNSIFDGTITGHDGKLTRIGGFVGKASLNDTVVTNAYSNSDKYIEKAADSESSIYPVSGPLYTTEDLATKIVSDLELDEAYWYNTPISAKLKLGLKVSDVDGKGTIDTQDFFYIRDNLLAIPFNYNSQVIDSNRDDELDICDLVFNNNIIKIHE